MMLRDFIERPTEIARAVAAGEWLAVERSSHLLLGSARYIGAPRVIDLLLTIEAEARRGIIAHDAVAMMIDETAQLRAKILVWRSANPV